MNVGILETGETPPRLVERFGRLDAMMRDMLGPAYRTTTFDVTTGRLPNRVEACGAYVITGSAAGVYDALPWIGALKNFLQQVDGRAKIVGICFGHQIMAEAFGGRVEKSPKGWGLGLHAYAVHERAPWMDEAESVAIPVSHQDQVVEQPRSAEVLGGSDFTPFGMLSYPDRRAISFQFHPEFQNGFAGELVELRRPHLADPLAADEAMASLQKPSDAPRVAAWIRRFLDEG
jgi:GMP synthase-like glutamine amidotransferase